MNVQTKKRWMRRFDALMLAAVLFVAGAVFLPTHGEERVYDSVVRLHVLANSDSEEDQNLKLLVRDEVLAMTAPLVGSAESREEAEAILAANLDGIRAAAERVTAAQGHGETVEVLLGREEYPERTYDSVCFPSGGYVSLRVRIGEAEGKNWWCCLFPPLCLDAARVDRAQAEDAFIAVGLTPSQYRIITETDDPVYRVRFRFLEILESAFSDRLEKE